MNRQVTSLTHRYNRLRACQMQLVPLDRMRPSHRIAMLRLHLEPAEARELQLAEILQRTPNASLVDRLLDRNQCNYICDVLRNTLSTDNTQDKEQAASIMRRLFPRNAIETFLQNPHARPLVIHQYQIFGLINDMQHLYSRHLSSTLEPEHDALIFWTLTVAIAALRPTPQAASDFTITLEGVAPFFDIVPLPFLFKPQCITQMLIVLTAFFPDFIVDSYFTFSNRTLPHTIRKWLFGMVWGFILRFMFQNEYAVLVRYKDHLIACLEFINLHLPCFMYDTGETLPKFIRSRFFVRSPYSPFGQWVFDPNNITSMKYSLRPNPPSLCINPILAMYRLNPTFFVEAHALLSQTTRNPVSALLTAATMLRLTPSTQEGQPSTRNGIPITAAAALTGPDSLGPKLASFLEPQRFNDAREYTLKQAMHIVIRFEQDDMWATAAARTTT